MIGLIAGGHLSEQVVAERDDVVQMSPGAYSHTLGTSANIVRLDYSKGAIIQNTTGDISLSLTLNSDASSVLIFVPPEFSFLQADTTSVWTSITNNYRSLALSRGGGNDAMAPSWWAVRIENATIPAGTYTVRMFNVKAPSVCGRYFMKVLVDGESIGPENFPTIVVEGGLDPAYISGRVLNGEEGQYGLPVKVPGRVIAQGTTNLGESVSGQAYFDASANGTYTIYGLAAGTYRLSASAAGFAPTATNETVTVYPGQSLSAPDIYVYRSATISVTISSKCVCGPVPWGYAYKFSGARYVQRIGVAVDASGNIIVVDNGLPGVFRQSPSGGAPTVIYSGAPYVQPIGVAVDASGNIIVVDNGLPGVFRQSPSGGAPTVIYSGAPYVNPDEVPRPISIELSDSSGAQQAVAADNTDPSLAFYHFTFNGSVKLDGHVPQDDAAYISGLAAGDYYINAFVNEYVQRDIIAVHVPDYSYTQNYMRGLSVSFDLWRSGWFQVTVQFPVHQTPLQAGGQLTLSAYQLDGTLRGSNSSLVPEGSQTWTMEITGVLTTFQTVGRFAARPGKDYGFPSGTYMIEATYGGYAQPSVPEATIGEGCSATSLALYLVPAGALEVTIRSINWQTPRQEVPWQYPGAPMRLELTNSIGKVYTANVQQQADTFETPANVTDLPADTYLVRAYTVGYVIPKDYFVTVSLGDISDINVDLLEATTIQITLEFRTEGITAPVDTFLNDLTQVPVRIEVYDTLGLLAGANATYIPSGVSNSTVDAVGFQDYAGNPATRWVNFYDTTDGSGHKDYGLPAGTYLVLVWVPGYLQAETATLSTSPTGIAGVKLHLDRLAHVYGNVRGLDMYGNLIPLSWATVTAYGPMLITTSSTDGFYEMWIMNGNYTLGVSRFGYAGQQTAIQVSMDWVTAVDFDLRPSGGTVPELSAIEMTLPIVLALVSMSCYLSTHSYRKHKE